MAFAPRPRTPTRGSSASAAGAAGAAAASSSLAKAVPGSVTIQRLLEIVNHHGVQLESLREEFDGLRHETEALRQSLARGSGNSSSSAKVKQGAMAGAKAASASRPEVPKLNTKAAGHKGHAEPASNQATQEMRRDSACSASSGSDAGGTGGGGRAGPKVRSDSRSSARSSTRESAIPRPRSARSSSAPTTPRGGAAPQRGGEEPVQRSATPRKARSQKLFDVAQPLLQPGITKEKRVIALSAVARCLKDGASPSEWEGPQTPLRSAVQVQDTDMARLLIQARADPNERDAKGVRVLHTASFDGVTDLCRTLLKARADANAADQHGQTAFFFAPNSSVCDVLLENKADVNAVNQKGQSALHLASRAGLTQVLLWMAPRVSSEIMDLRDIHGATAAYYARHAGISSDFLMRHKLSGEAVGEAEKRGSAAAIPSRVRGEEEQTAKAHSSRSAFLPRPNGPLPPVLEDQLDGEEEDAKDLTPAPPLSTKPMQTKAEAAMAAEEPPEAAVVPVEAGGSRLLGIDPMEAEEEPELPGSSTSQSLLEPLPELQDSSPVKPVDMEVTSCFFEEDSQESTVLIPAELPGQPLYGEQEPEEEEVGNKVYQPLEGTSPTSSLDRADQMVTWEEDCGCPGFALTGSTADGVGEVPEVAEVGDGNSIASDVSDTASPSKGRPRRRSSMNQVFLRPLDRPVESAP